MVLLPRKPLFLQGTTAAPVKTNAEDARVNLSAAWTPLNSGVPDIALRTRSGIVWGPGSDAATPPGTVSSPAAGVVQIAPARFVLSGPSANRGPYVETMDDPAQLNVADYGGLPSSGQFKAGRVIIRVYDQLYGDTQDGFAVELVLGAPATTAAAAVLPPSPGASLALRNFTVDSAGLFTFTGSLGFTTTSGAPLPCYSNSRPGAPWIGQRIWELDTGRTYERTATGWAYRGGGTIPMTNVTWADTTKFTDWDTANYGRVKYGLDANGRVVVQGLMRSVAAVNAYPTTLFTLPVGYRPSVTQLFHTVTTSTAGSTATPASTTVHRFDVLSTGQVNLQGGVTGANQFINLDNIQFSPDNN